MSQSKTPKITSEDAMERAQKYGPAGIEIRDTIAYIADEGPSNARCASDSVLMCQLGGAASNASLDPSLYELVHECIEAGFLPQLMHPEMCRRMGDKDIAGCETDFSLFNAFTFRLDPEDYKHWWNGSGDSGHLPFSEVELEHFRYSRGM